MGVLEIGALLSAGYIRAPDLTQHDFDSGI